MQIQIKSLDTVINELLKEKSRLQVQQKLFSNLKEQYGVVVHYSAFSDSGTKEKDE